MSLAAPALDLSHLEPTLIGPGPSWTRPEPAWKDSSSSSSHPRMQLIDASLTGRSELPGALLRQRLTAAASVLLACLLLMFARDWWLEESGSAWLRGLILVNTLGCLVLLIGSRKLSLAELRGIELALFVPIGIQLYSLQVQGLWEAARRHDLVEITQITHVATFGFALLMMAYGMFMPNSWKRTAVLLAPPALAPISLIGSGVWCHPWLAGVFPVNQLIEVTLVPMISAAVAVYASWTISTLRYEARCAQRLGQYRLTRELGHGGMGQVYLAEHQLLKRPCAIKVIHPHHVADPSALARFEREVRSTAKLSHWHTVEVYDYGHTDDGTFYYVMEYLPGLNLGELVQRFGPLPIGRAIHFLRQTCAALREAHGEGMIHRDLKPANIYAAERGGVYDVTKLLDFGLVADPREGGWLTESAESQQAPFAGSPLYMSPEQAMGSSSLDSRSDIYSLGAVGYYLLTGRPPFEGRSPWRVMQAHARDAVRPPSQFRPDLPADLEVVLLKCLAKRPQDRFADVVELGQALLVCAADHPWTFVDAEDWWMTHVTTCELSPAVK
ncbi:MAG: serine/threonine-protein kinase [Planctomycetaceae bacterium]